jgi:hypothetical protein
MTTKTKTKTKTKTPPAKAPLVAFASGFHAGAALIKAVHGLDDVARQLAPMFGSAYTAETGFPKWGAAAKALSGATNARTTRDEIQRGIVAGLDARYTKGGEPAAGSVAHMAWKSSTGVSYRADLATLGVASLSAYYSLSAASRKALCSSSKQEEAKARLNTVIAKAIFSAWSALMAADDRINGRARDREAGTSRSVSERIAASPVAKLPALRAAFVEQGLDVPGWLDGVIETFRKWKVLAD